MAEKIARRTIVRQTTHPSDSRSNISTAELESFARPEEKRPATVRYPRDPTLDPQLVWKGKDEQDNWGGAGRWAFLEITDPWDAESLIREKFLQPAATAVE